MNLPLVQLRRAGNSQKTALRIAKRVQEKRPMDVRHGDEMLRYSFTWQTGLVRWHYPVTRDLTTFAQVTHFVRGRPLPPALLRDPSSESTKRWRFLKPDRVTHGGHVISRETFHIRLLLIPKPSRCTLKPELSIKSTHTSSPWPSEQCFVDDKRGLKTQILIWSQCRCKESTEPSALTRISINRTNPPRISRGKVLSSGKSLSSKVYGCWELLGEEKGNSNRNSKANNSNNLGEAQNKPLLGEENNSK